MSTAEEYQELKEHAEHAQHDRSLMPVSMTMAVLAVLVAVVALLGHRTHTEEIVLETKASNQWSYYQAKNIRRHNSELFSDLVAAGVGGAKAEEVAKLREKYLQTAERYRQEQDEIESEARKLEAEAMVATRKANRFDLGEVFLEMALVITSITLLTRRRAFWKMGMVLAAVGIAIAATAYLVH